MPNLAQLEQDLQALERDQSLNEDHNFSARFLALRTLDFLEEAFEIQTRNRPGSKQALRVRALQTGLGRCNTRLFQHWRAAIRAGSVAPHHLWNLFEGNCRYRRGDLACLHWGAESADALAAGLFHSDCPPHKWDGNDSEMIHYESTPVSALLELVERVPLTPADRFVDIGSGLGQVALLVHLLSGVEAVGLEVLPAFVEQARREGAALGIAGATFVQGDARSADLGAGTVYFLFSPFRGQMLQTALGRLRRESAGRKLTVCSFGPCTEQIAAEPWLTLQEPGMKHEFRLAIFHSSGDKPE